MNLHSFFFFFFHSNFFPFCTFYWYIVSCFHLISEFWLIMSVDVPRIFFWYCLCDHFDKFQCWLVGWLASLFSKSCTSTLNFSEWLKCCALCVMYRIHLLFIIWFSITIKLSILARCVILSSSSSSSSSSLPWFYQFGIQWFFLRI